MFGRELMPALTPAQRVLIDRYPRPLEPEDPTLWLRLKQPRERDDVITGQYDRALKWLKSYGFSAEPGASDRNVFERALACDFPALLPSASSLIGADRNRSRFWFEEAKTISLREAMQERFDVYRDLGGNARPIIQSAPETLETSGRAIVVESANDGGIDHVAQERSIMAPLFRRRGLQHEQNKQVPRRVHPEISSADPAPEIIATRSGERGFTLNQPNGEP
jgi:hypothetical protein